MTTNDIAPIRLQSQCIASSHSQTAVEIVNHMGAMQAQDYYSALWTLGLRTSKTEQEIVHILESRSVIRTWPQRGTLHFVTAQNARWQVELSATRLLKSAATRQRNLGLNEDIFVQSRKILSRALAQSNYLTRPQILSTLEEAGIATSGGRGYHILWYLSQTGVIYVGPMKNKQQTFGLLDELTSHSESGSREENIAALAQRYFVSHGPATLQDFMWWSGLTATDAKLGLTSNEAALTNVVVGNKTYWMAKETTPSSNSIDQVFLLPSFDEYLLGYKDRSAVLPIEHAQKVVPGGNGMFLPIIIVHGQVVGTWKRAIKKDHVLLTLLPFQRLDGSTMIALQKPAQEYGAFLGLPPKIEIA